MNIADYRLIYMGTPEISAKTFEALIKAGFHFVALISQEDKEVGRKKVLTKTPTKIVAERYHIPVYQPKKIKEDYQFVEALKPDLIITFAYGQIIPKGLLNLPRFGCVNLHGSLLPKYRGAAPIQRAIIHGEKVTGITLMRMVEAMDAGEMYAKEEVAITPNDTYTSLSDKLSVAASKVAVTYIPQLLEGTLKGTTQDEQAVSFAPKILPEEEHLDLTLPADAQINYIRALADNPGAYLFLGEEKLKIYAAKIKQRTVRYPVGHIAFVEGALVYQAKDALIELIKVKPQGKNMMNGLDYKNGHPYIIGQSLK
ncbi:MAG: methionyl-tRNA formyltransferase [Bacilli bacterium]|nr:methionyl-tRNA formyltransferase [Bacilli bacterium]